MKKFSFKKLFDNNRFVLFFSVFIAILCWIVVVIAISPNTPRSIGDVPIQLDLRTDRLREMGLSVIGEVDTLVDVMVEGPRAVVGNLEPADLNITVSLSKVTEADTYDLELVPLTNPEDYTITSITPSTIRVRLDQVISKTLEVDLITRGLSVAAGYLQGTEQITPASVRVTGPASELDKAESCVATVELSESLSNTYITTVPLVLLDALGSEVDREELHLSMDVETADVRIPVLRTKELPLRVNINNVPRGFPESQLREYMTLEPETIWVAGPVSSMDSYSEIVVADIDLRSLTETNSIFSYEVVLPSDQFENMYNISIIQASFETESWSSVVFHNLGDITPLNQPAGYEITLLTSFLPSVTFVGDAETIAELNADDIKVELDFSHKELTSGQISYPVRISAPSKGLVWATGEYSVIIQVVDNTGASSPEDS